MSRRDYLKHLGFATSAAVVAANQTTAMSNEPTIAKMNRAICEFMGWEFREVQPNYFHAIHDGEIMWQDDGDFVNQILVDGFKYHEDWNKLMPVYHAIREKAFVLRSDEKAKLFYTKLNNCLLYGTIADVHLRSFQFIQWYNKQKEANNEQGRLPTA